MTPASPKALMALCDELETDFIHGVHVVISARKYRPLLTWAKSRLSAELRGRETEAEVLPVGPQSRRAAFEAIRALNLRSMPSPKELHMILDALDGIAAGSVVRVTRDSDG